jgi:hypothetical protein
MNTAAGHALEQALAYYRAPALLPSARDRRLPDDVIDLLRIAAGDESAAAAGADASCEPQDAVVEAAVFFVQQVLFEPGADSYRVLGVNRDAPDARIKENYRWLVRWLHPDRNLDDWDSVYADRVNRAWQDLRIPDRRSAYDLRRAAAEPLAAGGASSVPRARHRLQAGDAPADPLLSARTAQRLPVFVLGGLGLVACSLLALMWYATAGRVTMPAIAPPTAPLKEDALREAPAEPAKLPLATPAITHEPTPLPASRRPVDTSTLLASRPVEAVVRPPIERPETAPPAVAVVARADSPMPPPQANHVVAKAPAAPDVAAAPAPVRKAPQVATAVRPSRPSGVKPVETPASPAAAAAVVRAPASPVIPRVERQQAYSVLESFSTAYAAGDLAALMRLFTRDARNNRGGRDAIVFDYQSLFSTTRHRELRFVPSGWMQGDPDKATLLASYRASVTVAGKPRPEASNGQIRFDLRREDGVLKISQIRLENAD